MEVCADFNVTNTISCEEWCGATMTAEWMYMTGHGHHEDLHLAYLVGWMCHCSPQTETDEEKHCGTPLEFPTCSAMGLGDCGTNATMTCGELCDEVGLGAGGSGTAATRRGRHLYHTTNDHYCAHHEADHEEDPATRRILHGDEEHEMEGVTFCYCNAVEENSDGSTLVCADADVTQEEEQVAADTSSSGFVAILADGAILGAAIMAFLSI
jgi:hypothetical protein